MTRIVVAGGAGFLGAHLCEKLAAGPQEVICVDDLSSGTRANLERLEGRPNFFFTRHDVARQPTIAGDVDQIYYLAPVAGARHFLELARAKRSRFLFASSSEVYADTDAQPLKEESAGPFDPQSSPASEAGGKRFGEALTRSFFEEHEVDTAIARMFGAYGPRMPRSGRLIPSLLQAALRGAPLTVRGDGKQLRTFCFVTDLVEGLVTLMASSESDPVNFGSSREHTVMDVANRVKAVTGSKSQLVFEPARSEEPARRCPDTSRAKALLKWEAKTSLDDGLRRTADDFKKRSR